LRGIWGSIRALTATYDLSTAISSSLVNATAIRFMGFGVLETPTARGCLAVTSAFHLAVNIPAPFWDYYTMVVIGGDESWVTVKNVTMLSFKALALRILAPLIDGMGAKRIL
jgi:hypothetical protein